ncbi:sensor histidine kinase [Rhodococcus opacus]|uniref:histidine kinase n=1 Tax=Rhodococcus opacus (strain B4) TaxID=632772 RepID=C1B1K8_RHOOB|nr:histidine kinase [Rhodococcus opacus]BAH54703.1 putative two-component histidine kinase [Rhodococcus opacus B4]
MAANPLTYGEAVIEIPAIRRLRPLLRLAPLLLVPLLLLASTFPGEYRVPPSYWLLAMTAAVVFAAGGRWPLAVSIVTSVLAVPMFAAHAWGLSDLVPYLGAVALVDVAMRARRAPAILAATLCWTAAVVAGLRWDSYGTFWRVATVVSTVAYVGLPLLLGLYLRAQRDLAATYRQRAAEAESRRLEDRSRAVVAERNALARELHDLVAHHMASIVLRIGVAQHVLRDVDGPTRSVLEDVHRTASDALADIRRLLVALRDPSMGDVALVEPDALPIEIAAAVDRTRAAGFPVAADIDPGIARLDAIGRLTLLRVVQESLTNAMRHSTPGGAVSVTLEPNAGGIALRVTSTGHRATPADHSEGHGIIGMGERVELAGGTLGVTDTVNGWVVDAWLPGRVGDDTGTNEVVGQ